MSSAWWLGVYGWEKFGGFAAHRVASFSIFGFDGAGYVYGIGREASKTGTILEGSSNRRGNGEIPRYPLHYKFSLQRGMFTNVVEIRVTHHVAIEKKQPHLSAYL